MVEKRWRERGGVVKVEFELSQHEELVELRSVKSSCEELVVVVELVCGCWFVVRVLAHSPMPCACLFFSCETGAKVESNKSKETLVGKKRHSW